MTTKTPTELIQEMSKSVEQMEKDHAERGTLTDAIRKEVAELKDGLEVVKKAQDKKSLSLPGMDDKKFDLHMAIKAARLGNWDDAGYEAEVIRETHKLAVKAGHPSAVIQKDITAGTNSQGGFLVPVQVDQAIIPLAIAERPILSEMGITRLNNLAVGSLYLPKQSSRTAATWVGEQVALSKTTPAFTRSTMTEKKVGTYTICSNDMLRQGRGTIDQFIRADLGDAVALALEQALINGSGSSGQPLGIVGQSGLTSFAGLGTRTNGLQYGFRDAAGQANAIRKANMLKGKLGYVTAPDVLFGLKIQGSQSYSAQTSNTQPVSLTNAIKSDGDIDAILGYKMRTSTLIPINLTKGSTSSCTYVIFGDWSQVVLGMWGGTEIKVSDVASDGTTSAFTQDSFFVNILQTADILVRDPTAFTVISDALTVVGETI